ncbi:tRNA methyl transferase [Radiomyces spectabilis]|uniref:tRNA methyl transferase n=1 Tax=Radiomyces spectabilis TaxID=64574 RepID=UPI00221F1AD5|nr:tRNA methyl transferase [Radiomyces spectabilis]KAI8364718.1 tRNA methyl transferase [Radiomyces spectabilis]
MSGGVDSSVSAALLKQQGFRVQGIYMRNWDTADERGVCTSAEDWEDVQRVCFKLDIPCEQVDFVKEYWTDVFQQTLDDYAAGLTPNPDVMCNQYIKFGSLISKVPVDAWFATGHYCRTYDGRLLRGKDRNKDQSYYLSTVPEDALRRTMFPLGEFESKTQVKNLAEQLGLHVAAKRESMGICFVGQRRRFADFLAEYIDQPPGPAVDLQGNVIGQHRGLFGYTIGQASHICHGPHKWCVAEKDVPNNTLICVPGSNHPALFHSACTARNWVWIHPSTALEGEKLVDAQVRYRQSPQKAILSKQGDRYTVRFLEPVRAMARGQQVVVWDGDWCLGGGVIDTIESAFPSP